MKKLLSLLIFLAIASCTKFQARVVTFEDGFKSSGKTYKIEPMKDQKQDLEWRNLSRKIQEILTEKGVVFSQNPDYKIMFYYQVNDKNPSINSLGGDVVGIVSISTFTEVVNSSEKVFLLDIFDAKTNNKVYEVKIISKPSEKDIYDTKECFLEAFDTNFPSPNATQKTIQITLPCIKTREKRKEQEKQK